MIACIAIFGSLTLFAFFVMSITMVTHHPTPGAKKVVIVSGLSGLVMMIFTIFLLVWSHNTLEINSEQYENLKSMKQYADWEIRQALEDEKITQAEYDVIEAAFEKAKKLELEPPKPPNKDEEVKNELKSDLNVKD